MFKQQGRANEPHHMGVTDVMIPRNHQQAAALLIGDLGAALTRYSTNLLSLDPIPETPAEKKERTSKKLPLVEQPLRIPTAPSAYQAGAATRVTLSGKEWREVFMKMEQPFTANQVAEKVGCSPNTVHRQLKQFNGDVILDKKGGYNSGGERGRQPDLFRFKPAMIAHEAGKRAEREGPPPPPKLVHPERNGKSKPKVNHRELQGIIDRAWEEGWLVEPTNNGHLQFKSPDRESIAYSGTTPSDHRGTANLRAELERKGLRFRQEQKQPVGLHR